MMVPLKTSSDAFDLSRVSDRATVYLWLSHLFIREIEPGTLSLYQGGPGTVYLYKMARIPGMETAVSAIQDRLSQHRDVHACAEELAWTYGTLFHGAAGTGSVSPYESVYTDGNRSTHQEAERETQEILARLGLGVSSVISEPADHIAVQLSIMAEFAILAADPGSGTSAADLDIGTLQYAFLVNHLLNWVPVFARDCKGKDESGFYAALAELTVAVLEQTRHCFERSSFKSGSPGD